MGDSSFLFLGVTALFLDPVRVCAFQAADESQQVDGRPEVRADAERRGVVSASPAEVRQLLRRVFQRAGSPILGGGTQRTVPLGPQSACEHVVTPPGANGGGVC